MSTNTATLQQPGFTSYAPEKPSTRWFVCALLFAATTINYMDRSVLSLIEPLLHDLPFMGWDHTRDAAHQAVFNDHYGNIIICFQIAYGFGLLTAGRLVDELGTKLGYSIAIAVWACASISHSLVGSVVGFCIARACLGIGEAGNFPAAIKATSEWFPAEERAFATGVFNSGSNASSFIAPILIAAVTVRFGWRAAFVATGSLGLCWLVVWLLFPYNKLRRGATQTQRNLQPVVPAEASKGFFSLFGELARTRGLWAFGLGKGLTDPIWWFYLFYLPKFLNENYGLDLAHAKWQIITVYAVSSVGSIGGGSISGTLMKRGYSTNVGRKMALLICALCVVPIVLVPWAHTLSPNSAWLAVSLFALAAAGHQGWSATIFATPTDMFPSTAVSTVVGIGGAMGAVGGATFTWIVKSFFSLHPLLIFAMAASAYLTALLIIHLLVPRLGGRAQPA